MKIDQTIFRDYDIRGIYPTQINEKLFYILGRAAATYFEAEEIAVGYDCRLSSKSLFASLTSGIMDQGVNVVNLGLISTEMHYFASGSYNFPANIIISASHNPPEYNGLKIVTRGVVPLNGEWGLPEIKMLALKQKFSNGNKRGLLKNQDILDPWIKHVLSFIDPLKLAPLKVVVDAGNGMGGRAWDKIKGQVPVKIIPLYFDPDGNFPHHLPDPLNTNNLVDLQKEIIKEEADLGFAMDGDADRLFVLDEKGEIISGTITCAMLAESQLTRYGGGKVLYNVVCGNIVPETIRRLGGQPLRVRVGHSFIKQEMKKNKAIFAGEHSGHFYFKDNYCADSSTIAGLLLLDYISKKNHTLSRIVKEFDKYFSSGEINIKVKDVEAIINNLKLNFKDAKGSDQIDGLTIRYSNWWFNLRVSKTEPLIRLNLEADNKDLMEDKELSVKNMILSSGGNIV
ncbi:hypothetical protein A2960_01795 [Candidatus Gottesmanbacteria bacterium RIFCSPLOWO2_01_FULL_39_12b]|uniref:Phosphomannomutase/phosphoglucomutase n=1 Tax=Candidatus Gottesmanbacteria bacterium RIFCSPLOWO2_01_FULL_39_12b TaxID=1798388 RepID=A0A1F6AR21_9BACT|nr:MAG: hypothetical protein A2960_01795 [Candidatus Gottesmanbacteria bacterium RIFCSPLOWO2_01_FULL_39_12b]